MSRMSKTWQMEQTPYKGQQKETAPQIKGQIGRPQSVIAKAGNGHTPDKRKKRWKKD